MRTSSRPVLALLCCLAAAFAVMAVPGSRAVAVRVAPKAEARRARPVTPYLLGAPMPTYVRSPKVVKGAPYTPLVRSLIHQLEPSSPPTAAQLANAALLFAGIIAEDPQARSCHAVGGTLAPVGTTPSITPLCWADAVGVNLLTGPNANKTSATAEPLAIGASFDRQLSNAWGQLQGLEGRESAVTGLYGPEADISVQPNWERGLDTLGEDPYLNGELVAAQVDGMQGRGLMSQLKHFAGFSGANRYTLTRLQDQAFHEMLLAPFEKPVRQAKAATLMCAYDEYVDVSHHLPPAQDAVWPASPYSTAKDRHTKTWPLNEKHWACEQPLALNYVLRHVWHSTAFIGSDFPAIHSTASITQGAAQEFLYPDFLGPTDPVAPAVNIANTDPTGDECVNGANLPASCHAAGARHIGGIAGAGCNPSNGCGVVNAVVTGNLPLAVFNQALAQILYQEQRFGLLGCTSTPVARTCTNPGGVHGDASGNAAIPAGPSRGATAAKDLGTKSGDGAVVERLAEEGAVLLKNEHAALPLTKARLRSGIAVSGAGAEYLLAAPSNEASAGFPDRDAISPLAQLKALSHQAIGFSPADDPTGYPVPSSELSTVSGTTDGGLSRTAGPGSPAKDPQLDFTDASAQGRLAPGDYTWSGYVYAPRADSYTFRTQYAPDASSTAPVSISVDGAPQQLSAATTFYCGQYYAHNICVPVGTTNAGYTEGGLTNQQTGAMTLSKGYHAVPICFRNDSGHAAGFRFAYSRAKGDALDAAAAAKGKAAAVVFVNDHDVLTTDQDAFTPPSRGVTTLPPDQLRLIDAVSRANKNTVVVLTTADPVVVRPWIGKVRAVLEMWNSGSEGGTATARLLLGRADPSGHVTISWPKRPLDTTWGFRETRKLYPLDRLGTHPERLIGLTDKDKHDCNSYLPPTTPCTETHLSEGIFSGYRFFDKEHLAAQFPFGFGLSYTHFAFSRLGVRHRHGGLDVSFRVRNTGRRAGTAVAQVYVGAGPARRGVQQAVRALRGFQRVVLRPGQAQRVTIHVDARSFQYWDETTQRWTTDLGRRTIWVGDADTPTHLPLHATTRIGPTA